MSFPVFGRNRSAGCDPIRAPSRELEVKTKQSRAVTTKPQRVNMHARCSVLYYYCFFFFYLLCAFPSAFLFSSCDAEEGKYEDVGGTISLGVKHHNDNRGLSPFCLLLFFSSSYLLKLICLCSTDFFFHQRFVLPLLELQLLLCPICLFFFSFFPFILLVFCLVVSLCCMCASLSLCVCLCVCACEVRIHTALLRMRFPCFFFFFSSCRPLFLLLPFSIAVLVFVFSAII